MKRPLKSRIAPVVVALLASACHAKGPSASTNGDCQVTYATSGYAVNPKTKWTYFLDTVVEVTPGSDGVVLAFRKSSRRYRIPAGADPRMALAAKHSMDAASPVHVAVDESGLEATAPVPGGGSGGPLPPIVWLDPDKHHPSCAD